MGEGGYVYSDCYENEDDIYAWLPDPRRKDSGRMEVMLQLLIEWRLEGSSSCCESSVFLLFGKAYRGGALGTALNVYAGGGGKSGENPLVPCDGILGEDMGVLCKFNASSRAIKSER